MSSLDRLVYMANQIATAFRTLGEGPAAAATADHLRRYWDPRMRAMIAAHLADGGAGLNPIASAAVALLAPAAATTPR